MTPNAHVSPGPTQTSTSATPPAPIRPNSHSPSTQPPPTRTTNTQPSQSYWKALKQRLPLSERTHTIIAWVVGLAALSLTAYYGQQSLKIARKSWNLGVWTAKKDFNEWCKDDLVSIPVEPPLNAHWLSPTRLLAIPHQMTASMSYSRDSTAPPL